MRKIYCDGGGFLKLVAVLDADAGHLDIRPFKFTGSDPSSTVFEYFSIYLALTWVKNKLKDEIHKEIKIYNDSSTVVKELRMRHGAWKIGTSQLDILKNDCKNLWNELELTKNIDIEWIPRNRNPAGKALESIQKYAKVHFKTKKPNYLYKTKKKSK